MGTIHWVRRPVRRHRDEVARGAARSKRRRAGALLVLLAALALPVQALAGGQVPLKGWDSGSFTLAADACGPGVFAVVIDDAGKATHVGAYVYHADECFDGGAGTFSGTFTITAANGDSISGTYAGTVVGGAGELAFYEQDAAITGGTGRFAGASGAFHLSGIANLASLESSQRIVGTVSSPGSTG